MTSEALRDWQSVRAQSLDNLVQAHRTITGGRRGRQWLTEEVNHALIMRLAAEFQGFCRDLHDQSVEVAAALVIDQQLQAIFRSRLLTGRKLDTGNAGWGNVCSDFAWLGVSLADDVKKLEPTDRYRRRTEALDHLNDSRNAVAHQDKVKIARCHQDYKLTLATFRRWRRHLDGRASDMDQAVAAYLTQLAGSSPW